MKLLLILLAATAFGQYEAVCRTPECGRAVLQIAEPVFGQGRYCYGGWFGPYQDRCTGEWLPLPLMRSPRIEWLEPVETYTELVIKELSLRILMLESKVALLVMAAGGELKPPQYPVVTTVGKGKP